MKCGGAFKDDIPVGFIVANVEEGNILNIHMKKTHQKKGAVQFYCSS